MLVEYYTRVHWRPIGVRMKIMDEITMLGDENED